MLLDRLATDVALRRICGWECQQDVPNESTFSRDSTAIDAREKPVKKAVVKKQPVKRGRPKHGEIRIKPKTRIERQAEGMPLAEMIAELPTACDVGTKRNSQ